jgi:hypothetical protein
MIYTAEVTLMIQPVTWSDRTRPEVVSHVFSAPNAHVFEPQSKFCSSPTLPMPEPHVNPETFGDELDRNIAHLKESFSKNIFRALQQIFFT